MRRIAQEAKVFARMYCKWCASHGLTPSQGSVALGYGSDIGNKWAKGLSTPPYTKIRALADRMGIAVPTVVRAVEASRDARMRARV